jgi:hypothetical protein
VKALAVLLLLLLAACTVPPPSDRSALYVNETPKPAPEAEPVGTPIVIDTAPAMNETVNHNETADDTPNMVRLDDVVKGFAEALTRFNTTDMYPYLHDALKQRMTAEQLASVLLYFAPKNKLAANFQEVRKSGSDYVGIVNYGSDYTSWQVLELPLVHEEGEWHVKWFDEYSTRDGLIAACSAKLVAGPDDTAQVVAARQISASSCFEAAAQALRDSTICPYAVYDRERCYGELGVVFTKDMKIKMCTDTTGVQDNTTIAKCLWDLAVSESDVGICRDIETNRVERYFCLGQLGGMEDQPYQCNDSINDYTMKLCLQKFIDQSHDKAEVCANPQWTKFVNC